MSEAELYLIRQRMLSGKLAKAERGELAIPLPIGYLRRPSGEVILDPDEQAQHVVRLVFSAFRRLGTLNGVLRYLVHQEVQLPLRVHSGPSKGEIEWRRPTRETLQIMLHNPVYAGYYAYGRRQVEPRRKVPGRPSTGRVVKDSGEWLVLLPGRLPAYITPGEYEAVCAAVHTATGGRSPVARQWATRLAVQTTACGRRAGGSSTCWAGLSVIRPWRMAVLSAARKVARMRASVAGVTGWPVAWCWRMIAVNMAWTWAVVSSPSRIAPRCGCRYSRACAA